MLPLVRDDQNVTELTFQKKREVLNQLILAHGQVLPRPDHIEVRGKLLKDINNLNRVDPGCFDRKLS